MPEIDLSFTKIRLSFARNTPKPEFFRPEFFLQCRKKSLVYLRIFCQVGVLCVVQYVVCIEWCRGGDDVVREEDEEGQVEQKVEVVDVPTETVPLASDQRHAQGMPQQTLKKHLR